MQTTTYFNYLKDARKNIEPKNFREIHDQARLAVSDLKAKESEVIKALQKVDQYKVYRYLGFNSLFQYAISLGLSEAQSYNYITVARKSIQIPQLHQAIENKEITVSSARTITSVIEEKNQMHWLELAKTLPKKELEREVAKVNPKVLKKESSRFVAENLLELNVTVSEETFKLLNRVKELLAQKNKRPIALEETIKTLAEEYVKKQDPLERAKRAISKAKNQTSDEFTGKSQLIGDTQQEPVPGQVRKPIPAAVKHQVYLRDRGQCQYKLPSGKICGQAQWIDLHHLRPKNQGGPDTVDNLITLCKGHHLLMHDHGLDKKK